MKSMSLVITLRMPDSASTSTTINNQSSGFQIYDLPWEDLVFSQIFPKLNLSDLCRLGQSSKMMQKCVTDYFSLMKHLHLTYTGPRFTVVHLHRITKSNHSLQSLDLSAAKQWLANEDVLTIVQNNPCLESVNLRGCSFLKEGLLQEMARCCTGLRRAYLGDCHWVTTTDLLQLAAECHYLDHIDLSGCWNLNDDTFAGLIQSCKILKHVNISDIYSITDSTVSLLACNCPELNVLKIKACWRVTDDSIRMLGECCKNLKILQVKDCRSVTDASLARLRVRGVLVDVPARGFIPSSRFSHLNEAQRCLCFKQDILKLKV